VDEIAKAGATAIIQPGGSVKDEEVMLPPTSTSWRWCSQGFSTSVTDERPPSFASNS
jgi:hypothetical protein